MNKHHLRVFMIIIFIIISIYLVALFRYLVIILQLTNGEERESYRERVFVM